MLQHHVSEIAAKAHAQIKATSDTPNVINNIH